MDILTTVCAGEEVVIVTTFALGELDEIVCVLGWVWTPLGPVMMVKVTTIAPGIVV